MSSEFYLDSFVLFPEKEKVFAFFPSALTPFKRVEIGFSEPIEDFHIKRDGSQTYSVFEYVVSGKGEMIIDGQKYFAKAGDIFVLREGEPHDYSADPSAPMTKLWIKYEAVYTIPMFDAYGVQTGIYHAEGARTYFERLQKLPETKFSEIEAAFMVSECVNKIIYLAAASKSVDATCDEVRIREALDTSVYQKMDLDLLAKKLHISKSNIIRKYKKRYDITPYEYLLNLKIENAKIMLKSTSMTIREIAERLCITDEHYFSSLFCRRVGMRPLAYRNANRDI
ncbi:MAG: helix-turn-helix domain-containing protein [Clostridia bacterium]|nr:helix-turn-helix domain-containing protein [Clostridia bacterium]